MAIKSFTHFVTRAGRGNWAIFDFPPETEIHLFIFNIYFRFFGRTLCPFKLCAQFFHLSA